METTDNRNKTTLWIAGVSIAIFLCGLVACAAVIGGLAWIGSQTAEEATVKLDVPVEMQGGKPVEFSVNITNVLTEPIELDSIDISLDYLSGMVIESTDPPFTETSQYDSFGDTFQTFTYHVSIAPEETLSILFSGRTVLDGDFSGLIDVCINSSFNCKSNIVRTIIK